MLSLISCILCSHLAANGSVLTSPRPRDPAALKGPRLGNVAFEEIGELGNPERQPLTGRIIQGEPQLRRLPADEDLLKPVASASSTIERQKRDAFAIFSKPCDDPGGCETTELTRRRAGFR